jgi:hypothetical protein
VSRTIQCPECGALLAVEIELGKSIMRTLDLALLEHKRQDHS